MIKKKVDVQKILLVEIEIYQLENYGIRLAKNKYQPTGLRPVAIFCWLLTFYVVR